MPRLNNRIPTGSATVVLPDGAINTAYELTATALLQGFTDPDNDPLSVQALFVDNGTLIENTPGRWTFTPSSGYQGKATLDYVVSDGWGGDIAANLAFTLKGANQMPTGQPTATLPNDDAKTDTRYTLDAALLLQGFKDPDGDALQVASLFVDHGRLTDLDAGRWLFTPDANYTGPVTVDYVVSDGRGGELAASRSFKLDAANSQNTAPTGTPSATLANARQDSVYTLDAALLLQGFQDADGDALNVAAVFVDHGTLTEINPTQWAITPDAQYTGPVNLDYVISDGRGGDVAATQVFNRVTVGKENAPPTGTATATLADGTVDTAYTLDAALLLQGFTDPDGDTLSLSALYVDHGSLTERSPTQWTFTPDAQYSGPVNLDYVVMDGRGGALSASQKFTLKGQQSTPITPAKPTLSIADAGFTETNGNQKVSVTVTLSATSAQTVTVRYAAQPGTASATTDYTLKAGALTFKPGETRKAIPFTLKGDTKAEAVEQFKIVLSSPKNASLALATAVITVTDNDQNPGNNGGSQPNKGTAGNDFMQGSAGSDRLSGLGGDDTLLGLGGADTLDGGTGNDALDGGEGNDRLLGGDENDTLLGGTGNDVLEGGDGDDVLTGGDGDDRLIGGPGADTMTGGAGDDVYEINNRGDRIIETGQDNGGIDSVESSMDFSLADASLENVEHLSLLGLENLKATGNDRDNRITGNAGNNVLNGGAGKDTLVGGAGDDTLDGGTSADRLEGGTGSDTYLINSQDDTIIETAKGGDADEVRSSVSYVLGDNLEILTLTGTNAINGSGNSLDNILTGNALPNALAGKDGADDLAGGLGDDTLEGGRGNDTLDGGEGRDTAVFKSNFSNFNLNFDADNASVMVADIRAGVSALGSDQVRNTEKLAFDDRSLILFESAAVVSAPELSAFEPGTDQLVFWARGFGLTGTGRLHALDSSRFVSAPGAVSGQNADDRWVYDQTSGKLYFDADGNGNGKATVLAVLIGQPTLQASDIMLV
ncbi:MAG: cadherin-like domain-containing protein [Methylococcaceae bacterium]